MPNIYYCSTCMLLYPHLMAKLAQEMAENPDLLRHETRQHGAVKVWWRALPIMLGVFITLSCTHTMPNIYYCSTCMLLYPHLKAKLAQEMAENQDFFWSEAWNPPTWGSKSMMEGSTIMLGVFITLLYPHTMPNIYYCSTCMLLYPHLMAKLVQELAENRDFSWSEAWNPPAWGCKSHVWGLYNHAGSVHHFVLPLYNAKHLLL